LILIPWEKGRDLFRLGWWLDRKWRY